MLFATTMAVAVVLSAAAASADRGVIKVTVKNIAPSGGTYLTPVFVGLHDGSFDSFDITPTATENANFASLAELGMTAGVATDFDAGATYVTVGGENTLTADAQTDGERRSTTVGAAPIGPGATQSSTIANVQLDGTANRYASFLSMVLPSSDYIIANQDPLAINLKPLLKGDVSKISKRVNVIYDAGTEVNDFLASAGNGFFPFLPQGADGADATVSLTETVGPRRVYVPFSGFANFAAFDTTGAAGPLQANCYNQGLAIITFELIDGGDDDDDDDDDSSSSDSSDYAAEDDDNGDNLADDGVPNNNNNDDDDDDDSRK